MPEPAMPSAVDLLYYAPGGGMGHATRAAAILRQVRRQCDLRLLAMVTTPLALPLEHEGIPYYRPADLAPDALRRDVGRLLAQTRPRILVVDTFPLGIVEELHNLLPALDCRKVLVARRLQEGCAAWGAPAWAWFDRVLPAEELRHEHPLPILLRDAAELQPRDRARAMLGVETDAPVVLGVSSDTAAWTADFFNLLRKIHRRLPGDIHLRLASPHLTPDDPLRMDHYPLLELFNGVDLLIGPCGYHLFHEAHACRLPAIFLPRPRRYDDQSWRARHAVTADSPEEMETKMRDMLEAPRMRETASYENGACVTAEEIIRVAQSQ